MLREILVAIPAVTALAGNQQTFPERSRVRQEVTNDQEDN
jgi:hypothetical protein